MAVAEEMKIASQRKLSARVAAEREKKRRELMRLQPVPRPMKLRNQRAIPAGRPSEGRRKAAY